MEAAKRAEKLQGESVELLRQVVQELKALRAAIEQAAGRRGERD